MRWSGSKCDGSFVRRADSNRLWWCGRAATLLSILIVSSTTILKRSPATKTANPSSMCEVMLFHISRLCAVIFTACFYLIRWFWYRWCGDTWVRRVCCASSSTTRIVLPFSKWLRIDVLFMLKHRNAFELCVSCIFISRCFFLFFSHTDRNVQ